MCASGLEESRSGIVGRMKHVALAGAFILVSLVACGSSPQPKASSAAPSGAPDTPGAKCLAIAGAKRERKADEPSRVGLKHILVRYAGAKSAKASTRTREDACLRALEARSKLEQGMSFADAVVAYSEEPGAATREGLVGSVQRSDLVPPFADAAFELGPRDVSHVVETEYGFHVILRTE
jgi:NIMA-interacting peptidyl-prolyl cis-trans isomerase 1